MKLFLLTIHTEYGISPWAFSTHEKAVNRLYQFVEEWWDDVGVLGPIPEDKMLAIKEYFNEYEYHYETYSINETTVDEED